ncbi:MAG: HEAT repeat domain-containing protein [Anaerolineae bacterium]|nr:HEAT repeat domain-containing protein [Anaerolineae bacterium]
MSTTERLIAYHLARLKDKNPQVRIASIRELALLEALNAYGALEAIYHTDPDPAVRKAAAGSRACAVPQKERDRTLARARQSQQLTAGASRQRSARLRSPG